MHSKALRLVRRAMPSIGATLLRTTCRALAAVSVLGACSLAQAGVLSFEIPVTSITAGSQRQIGQYWVDSYGYGATQPTDVVGAIVDGSDPATCPASFSCPVGNASHYYAGLNDGYLYFGLVNGGVFHLKSLQASVIGAGQSSFPATAGVLLIQGFDAQDKAVGGSQTIFLPGPDLSSGDFSFAQYDFSPLSSNAYSYVRIFAYACNFNLSCYRTLGDASVGIDNIVTQEVPEPGSLALIGLAALGLGFSRRKKG